MRIRSYSNNFTFWSCFSLLLALVVYQASKNLHLYSDGSHFLINILTEQSFFQPHYSRQAANFLKQLIPVLMIKSGLIDIAYISFGFGLSQYLIPLLGLMASWLVLPRDKKIWMIFSLGSFLLNLHHNQVYGTSESFVSVAFFWPLFFYILFCQIRLLKTFLAIAGIILISTTYEAGIILQAILVVAFITRIKVLFAESPYQALGIGLAMGMGVLINFSWMQNSPDPGMAEDSNNFLTGLLQFKILHYLRLSFPLIGLLIIYTFFRFSKKWRIALNIAFVILLALIIEQSFKGDQMFYPELHWEHRSLIIGCPAILALILLPISRHKALSPALHVLPYFHIIGIVIVMLIYQVRLTNLWDSFTTDLVDRMESTTGVFPYEKTDLANSPEKNQFATYWTLPTLSLALQAMETNQIKSLPSISDDIWQPWYPGYRYSWPNLRAYGIRYRFFGPNIFEDS